MMSSCHHLSDDPRTCLYFTPSPPLSWGRAAQACVAMGGHLAVLEDDDETYDAFTQQLVTYPQDSRRFWIGLRKQYDSFDWVWNAVDLSSETYLYNYEKCFGDV